jgi:hypothetical protein
MRIQQHAIEHTVHVHASPAAVWENVTQVDIASFRHPGYFRLLGVPKPLRAEIVRSGVGGSRTAYFSRGLRFTQEITAWLPPQHYAFTFHADPGFRVGHVLDLANGPFQLKAGAYHIVPDEYGVLLTLSSRYELSGLAGACLRLPVRLVMALFQRYLLNGIRTNAERQQSGQHQPANGDLNAEGDAHNRD